MNVTKKTLYFEDCIEGKVWQGGTFVLYEQEIINFAEQWDPQAIHVNKALAEKSFYGGLIAPSAYIFAITSKLFHELQYYHAIIGVETSFKIPTPARVGDILTFKLTCLLKRSSKKKTDRGVVTFGVTLTTQNKNLVFDGLFVLMMYTNKS
jgi:acyl dehydratase